MPPLRKYSWRHRLAALVFGCCLALLLAEIFVRCYPPFRMRILGGRLTLSCDTRTEIHNDNIAALDPVIVHSTNSLGFRGPDPPPDFGNYLTLVAVGGSTTECSYLDDSRTWPVRLATLLERDLDRVWVNNAGIDGHSTCGHQLLLKEYVGPLRPKIVLYLVGINEVGNAEANRWDKDLLAHCNPGDGWPKRIGQRLAEHSAVMALLVNVRRHFVARTLGLVHGSVNHGVLPSGTTRPISDEELQQELERHRADFLPGYESRLRHLVVMTREFGSEPVLLTQPVLCGPVHDDVTGTDLATIRAGDGDGATKWEVLELYNEVTRRIADDESLLVIDLARRLPKSTRYFYDWLHYTNAGAQAVAKLTYDELGPYLSERYPEFRRSRVANKFGSGQPARSP